MTKRQEHLAWLVERLNKLEELIVDVVEEMEQSEEIFISEELHNRLREIVGF